MKGSKDGIVSIREDPEGLTLSGTYDFHANRSAALLIIPLSETSIAPEFQTSRDGGKRNVYVQGIAIP